MMPKKKRVVPTMCAECGRSLRKKHFTIDKWEAAGRLTKSTLAKLAAGGAAAADGGSADACTSSDGPRRERTDPGEERDGGTRKNRYLPLLQESWSCAQMQQGKSILQ